MSFEIPSSLRVSDDTPGVIVDSEGEIVVTVYEPISVETGYAKQLADVIVARFNAYERLQELHDANCRLVRDLQDTEKDASRERERLREHNDKLREDLNDVDKRNSKLRKELDDANKSLRKQLASKGDSASLEIQQALTDQQRTRIGQLDQQVLDERKLITELHRNATKLNQQVKNLRASVTDRDQQISDIREGGRSEREAASELRREATRMRTEIQHLASSRGRMRRTLTRIGERNPSVSSSVDEASCCVQDEAAIDRKFTQRDRNEAAYLKEDPSWIKAGATESFDIEPGTVHMSAPVFVSERPSKEERIRFLRLALVKIKETYAINRYVRADEMVNEAKRALQVDLDSQAAPCSECGK